MSERIKAWPEYLNELAVVKKVFKEHMKSFNPNFNIYVFNSDVKPPTPEQIEKEKAKQMKINRLYQLPDGEIGGVVELVNYLTTHDIKYEDIFPNMYSAKELGVTHYNEWKSLDPNYNYYGGYYYDDVIIND